MATQIEIVKIKKHSNQFTMSVLFCVILFYIIFLVSAAASVGTEQRFTGPLVPLYLPLSEFVNTGGTIYTRETIRESSPVINSVFSRVCGEFNNKI